MSVYGTAGRAGYMADLGLLVLRLGIGIIFVAHGSQKLLGWFGGPGPQGFVAGMAQSGIPAVFAWLAIIAEFFGGLGLIFGILPRLSALGIICVMAVAVWKVHWANGFFLSNSGYEFNLALAAGALAILLAGPGRFAIMADWEGRLLSRRD